MPTELISGSKEDDLKKVCNDYSFEFAIDTVRGRGYNGYSSAPSAGDMGVSLELPDFLKKMQ